jgi:hypothetical protein
LVSSGRKSTTGMLAEDSVEPRNNSRCAGECPGKLRTVVPGAKWFKTERGQCHSTASKSRRRWKALLRAGERSWRIQKRFSYLPLVLNRETDDFSLLNRPARGFICSGDNEIRQRAPLDFCCTFQARQNLMRQARLQTGGGGLHRPNIYGILPYASIDGYLVCLTEGGSPRSIQLRTVTSPNSPASEAKHSRAAVYALRASSGLRRNAESSGGDTLGFILFAG